MIAFLISVAVGLVVGIVATVLMVGWLLRDPKSLGLRLW